VHVSGHECFLRHKHTALQLTDRGPDLPKTILNLARLQPACKAIRPVSAVKYNKPRTQYHFDFPCTANKKELGPLNVCHHVQTPATLKAVLCHSQMSKLAIRLTPRVMRLRRDLRAAA
jgi:hypothetical protein